MIQHLIQTYLSGMPALTWTYVASQIFTLLAFALGNIAYLQKDDRRLKIILGSSAYTNGVHYIFLGRWDGFLLSAVGGTRHVMAGLKPRADFFLPFVIVGTALGILFWKDARDIFSILANILACFAVYKNEGLTMRYWLLINTACWVIYSFLAYSAFGVLIELFYISSNLLTIRKMLKEKARG